MKHIPNILTILRLFLVIPIVWYILEDRYGVVLVLMTIAGLSDALDGLLARAFAWQSRLGSFLDPVADKTLMVVTFVALAFKGLVPGWLFLAVLIRDVIIIVGALAYQKKTHALEMQPTFSGKLNTALQVIFVVTILLNKAGLNMPQYLITVLTYLLLFTTVISGFVYVSIWTRKANNYDNH